MTNTETGLNLESEQDGLDLEPGQAEKLQRLLALTTLDEQMKVLNQAVNKEADPINGLAMVVAIKEALKPENQYR